jgi:hypothetical protein
VINRSEHSCFSDLSSLLSPRATDGIVPSLGATRVIKLGGVRELIADRDNFEFAPGLEVRLLDASQSRTVTARSVCSAWVREWGGGGKLDEPQSLEDRSAFWGSVDVEVAEAPGRRQGSPVGHQ